MAVTASAKSGFAFLVIFFIALLSSPLALAEGRSCRVLISSITEITAAAVPEPNQSRPEDATARPRRRRAAEPPKVEVIKSAEEITRELEEQDRSLWRINIQHFYESAVQFFQKRVTVSSVRSTLAQERSRKLNLIHFLSQGKHNEAIDIYRRIFDNVELSYWTIKTTERQLLQEDLPVTTKIRLEKRLLWTKRLFAQNYGEYIAVRSYLQNIDGNSNASPLFIETAAQVLKYLGVHKFSEVNPDFASLHIPEDRVPLQEVKNLFRSGSEYTRYKLLGDFRNEIFSALRYLVSSEILVSGVDAVLNRFPPHAADKLKNLVGLMRSAQLRQRNLPQLVEIHTYR